MAFEADRVVVELIAKTDGFDAKVTQSAAKFDASMNKIAGSAAKAEAATGKTSVGAKEFAAALKVAGNDLTKVSLGVEKSQVGLDKFSKAAIQSSHRTQILGSQIGNMGALLVSGQNPFTVLARQGPQVANAMRLVSLGGSVVGGVLGGILVTGALAAVGVLIQLILKSKDASDEIRKLVEKLEEQAEKTRQAATAQQIFDRSIEGSILKIDELTKALIEQNRTLEETINLNKAAAASALGNVAANIGAVSAAVAKAASDLQNAYSELALAESGMLGGTPSEIAASVSTAQARVVAAEANVRALAGTLEALNAAANRGATALEAVDFPLFERNAKEAVDPIAAINRKFDDMAKKAKSAGTYTAELAKQIEKLRAAELKAAREKPKTGTSPFILPVAGPITSGFGPRAAPTAGASTFHKGIDIKAALGTPVKAAAGGVVIHSGKLGGLGNVVIVDHGGGTITQYAHLSSAIAESGQRVGQGQVIGKVGSTGVSTGNHLDFRVKVGGKFVDPSKLAFPTDEAAAELKVQQFAEKAEREAERAAEAAIREQNRFEEGRSRLNDALLQAQQALVGGIEAEARIAEQQVFAEERRLNEALQNDVEEGKLTQAHADELKVVVHKIAVQNLTLIERQKQLKLLQEQNLDAQQEAQFRIDSLEFADELARSASESREIQLQILDIAYGQRKKDLEYLKLQAERNGKLEEANRIQRQIENLPAEKARDATRIGRATMGPMETFLDSIPQSAAEANEALEEMAVSGIRSVIDGLGQAGTEWIKLGGTAGKIINQLISDLIRLVLYQQVLGPLMKLFSGGVGAGGTPIFTPSNPGVPSAKGNVFAGGNLVPFGAGGVVNRPTVFPMANGGIGLMAEAGEEAIMPLGRDSQGRLGVRISNARAASSQAGGDTYISMPIYANDAVLAETVKGWVREGVSVAIQSGAQGGASMAREGLARKTLHRLG